MAANATTLQRLSTLRHSRCCGCRASARGFSLVELVVVMLVMALIGTLGVARFADREPFAVQGVADQLVSSLRVAQATALAQRLPVYVMLQASPAALQVCLDAACAQPLPSPAGDVSWLADAGSLRLSAAANFSFGAGGAPSFAAALQLQVLAADGTASPAIVVEPVSGHVHAL